MKDYEFLCGRPVVTWVPFLVARHGHLWEGESLEYWVMRLEEEMTELVQAVEGRHEHPWELEAAQVAAIAINMLRHKATL